MYFKYRSKSVALSHLLASFSPQTKYIGTYLPFSQYFPAVIYLPVPGDDGHDAGPEVGMGQADIPGRGAAHRMAG